MKQILILQQRNEVNEKKRRLEEMIFKGKALLAERRLPRVKTVREDTQEAFDGDQEANLLMHGPVDADKINEGAALSEFVDLKSRIAMAQSSACLLAAKLCISQLHVTQSARTKGNGSNANDRTMRKLTLTSHGACLRRPSVDMKGFACPPLNILTSTEGTTKDSAVWRRLQRHLKIKGTIRSSFIESRIQGAIDSVVNTASQPTIVGMVHPASGINYEIIKFHIIADDSIMITEVLEATVQSLEQQKGLQPDSDMSATDRLLAQSGKTTSTADDHFVALENRAFVRCKLGNTDGVEECLDQEVAVENRDEHGNTLVIIAAQQNNKKMLKMLLRRGADINAQNSMGNAAIHYTHEYKFDALAQYILDKGGDDTLLNMKGLTCYEGVGGIQ